MPDTRESLQLPLTLRKRVQLLSARYNKWILLGLLLLVLLPFLLIALMADGEAGFGEALKEEMAEDWRLWVIVVAVPVAAVFYWVTIRYERLTVTSLGLEYRSPLRGPLAFLHFLKPDWRLSWTEIRSASLRKGMKIPRSRAHQRELVLDCRHGEERKLVPYAWYASPDEAGLTLGDVINLRDERYLEAVEQSPLYRAMSAQGLLEDNSVSGEETPPEGPLAELPGGSFDLTGHPGMLAVLGSLVLVGGYALLDGLFLSPWRYLEAPPAGILVAAGVLALVAAAFVTRSAPRLERWSVSALCALAAAGAAHPGMLRVNAATDADGASAYRYRQVETGRFESVDRPGMPELVFTQGREFWEHFPPDAEREFTLARGKFSFWQLDLDEVREAQRRFYRERRAAGNDE
jgi:hypothetical protein